MTRAAPTAGLVLALLAVAACDAGAQSPAANPSAGARKKMITLSGLKGLQKLPLNPVREPLRPGKPTLPPVASATPGPGYTRPFANDSQNSRLPSGLPDKQWKPAWKLPLDPEFPARFVLALGDRAVVHSRQWHLVDANSGRSLLSDRLGGGPIIIDPALRAFVTHYPSAYLSLRFLADGRELFKYLPGQGDVFSRAFVTRHASRLLILGWERSLDPHGHKRAERSRIEILDLGMPPKADGFGLLASSSPVGDLYIGWVGVQMASGGNAIVAAAENELYLLDWNMNLSHVFEGSFVPHSLSLDEAGNIFLAGQRGNANYVWKITQKGEIAWEFALPGGPLTLDYPPIVGYDHTVFQIAGQHLYALDENGRLLWSRAAEGGLAGAVVTADHQLLASEGSCVVAYNKKGERRQIHCLTGETLVTPPVLNESGQLLAATKSHLHALK